PGMFGPPPTMAAAFAASINAVCPGTAGSIRPFLIVCLKSGPGSPVILGVGPAFTPASNHCIVSGLALPTTGPCSFNPEIIEVPATGQDANGNGVDDYIDIATGTSADVNGNKIPDECESCFPPDLDAKPESQGVQLGQTLALGVHANGTEPLTYQW